MAKRYELPDAAWELIKDLVSPEQKMGRPRSDDRLVLNGIFWILCSGAAWRDLPERFGPWSTVYQRFRDWRDGGTFDQLLECLHVRLNQEGLIDLDTWMIDSTVVRAARASSGAGKRGAGRTARPCIGTQPRRPDHQDSPGLRCQRCAARLPAFARAGQRHWAGLRIPGKPGRPRKRCRWLLADKGCDAEHLRQYSDRYRIQPVIPQRTIKRKPKPGLPRLFNRPKYRQRSIIERMFGWLKESRRIGTRYDKLARSFAAMVTLACTLRCLRQCFSYKT